MTSHKSPSPPLLPSYRQTQLTAAEAEYSAAVVALDNFIAAKTTTATGGISIPSASDMTAAVVRERELRTAVDIATVARDELRRAVCIEAVRDDVAHLLVGALQHGKQTSATCDGVAVEPYGCFLNIWTRPNFPSHCLWYNLLTCQHRAVLCDDRCQPRLPPVPWTFADVDGDGIKRCNEGKACRGGLTRNDWTLLLDDPDDGLVAKLARHGYLLRQYFDTQTRRLLCVYVTTRDDEEQRRQEAERQEEEKRLQAAEDEKRRRQEAERQANKRRVQEECRAAEAEWRARMAVVTDAQQAVASASATKEAEPRTFDKVSVVESACCSIL